MAHSIRPRGFGFSEYVVIMSHHFAAYCLAKWGDKAAWRAELERLWNDAPPAKHEPRAACLPPTKPRPQDVVISKPRGRACDHAAQIEKVYQLLLNHRAGAQALVQTAELASEAGIHRVTVAGILAELRSAGRITTARAGRYGGLIVSFRDVAISEPEPQAPPTAGADQPKPDVAILSPVEPAQPIAAAQTAIEHAASMEETYSTNKLNCVSSVGTRDGYNSPVPAPPPVPAHPAEPVRLADVVRELFDVLQVDQDTGEKRRVTTRQLLAFVRDLGRWPEVVILRAINEERRRRRCAAVIADIASMSPATLRAQLRLMERLADRSRAEGSNLCRYADWAARELRAELARRPAEPGRKPRKVCERLPDLRAAGERHQAELFVLVDQVRATRPRPAPAAVAVAEQHQVETPQIEPTPTLASLLAAIQAIPVELRPQRAL